MIKYYLVMVIAMWFMHIVDDFYLQGKLAQMKQRSWWQQNVPDVLYEKDYIVALCMHSISWSIMTHGPIIVCGLIFAKSEFMLCVFASIIVNAILHAFIDNKKANKKEINLTTDQCLHILQITATSTIMIILLELLKL